MRLRSGTSPEPRDGARVFFVMKRRAPIILDSTTPLSWWRNRGYVLTERWHQVDAGGKFLFPRGGSEHTSLSRSEDYHERKTDVPSVGST